MVLTGDSLLVGDAGRPDFGGEIGARQQWESLRRLLQLEDYVEVFPSHFDGPCGKGMCGRPSTTVGFERRYNPLLQLEREAFVRTLSTDPPPRPLNMNAVVATNRGERDSSWSVSGRAIHVPEIDATQAYGRLSAGRALLFDVREAHEYESVHAVGAIHLPQHELADRLAELESERQPIFICQAGVRSLRAAGFAAGRGVAKVASLRGGTSAWLSAGLPVDQSEPIASPR
jgi:rhodanese-related sulfurtransferase